MRQHFTGTVSVQIVNIRHRDRAEQAKQNGVGENHLSARQPKPFRREVLRACRQELPEEFRDRHPKCKELVNGKRRQDHQQDKIDLHETAIILGPADQQAPGQIAAVNLDCAGQRKWDLFCPMVYQQHQQGPHRIKKQRDIQYGDATDLARQQLENERHEQKNEHKPVWVHAQTKDFR